MKDAGWQGVGKASGKLAGCTLESWSGIGPGWGGGGGEAGEEGEAGGEGEKGEIGNRDRRAHRCHSWASALDGEKGEDHKKEGEAGGEEGGLISLDLMNKVAVKVEQQSHCRLPSFHVWSALLMWRQSRPCRCIAILLSADA